MSLITCDECGKEISSRAGLCSHCGCPNETRLKSHHKEQTEEEDSQTGTLHRPIVNRNISLLVYATAVLIGYLQINSIIKRLNAEMEAYGQMHEQTGKNVETWWTHYAQDLEVFSGMQQFGAGARAIGQVHAARGELDADTARHSAGFELTARETIIGHALDYVGFNSADQEIAEETETERKNLANKTELLRREITKLARDMGRLNGNIIQLSEREISDEEGDITTTPAFQRNVSTASAGELDLIWKDLRREASKDYMKDAQAKAMKQIEEQFNKPAAARAFLEIYGGGPEGVRLAGIDIKAIKENKHIKSKEEIEKMTPKSKARYIGALERSRDPSISRAYTAYKEAQKAEGPLGKGPEGFRGWITSGAGAKTFEETEEELSKFMAKGGNFSLLNIPTKKEITAMHPTSRRRYISRLEESLGPFKSRAYAAYQRAQKDLPEEIRKGPEGFKDWLATDAGKRILKEDEEELSTEKTIEEIEFLRMAGFNHWAKIGDVQSHRASDGVFNHSKDASLDQINAGLVSLEKQINELMDRKPERLQ